jgi:hypothetical protein
MILNLDPLVYTVLLGFLYMLMSIQIYKYREGVDDK